VIATVHVPTGSYYSGRTAKVRLLVLHTTESPSSAGRAVGVATYLANLQPPNRASTHYVTDAATIATQVAEPDTAWAAPGGNADGIQIEQCGYAGWGADDWAADDAMVMLLVTAGLIADICQRNGIPIRHLSNAELDAGQSGVVGHVQVSEVYRQSDHWDPGPAYPYDLVLGWANQLAGSSGTAGTVTPPTPVPPATAKPTPLPLYRKDDSEMMRYVEQKGSAPGTVPGDGTVWAINPNAPEAYPIASPYTVTVLQAHGVLMTRQQMIDAKLTYETDGGSIRSTYQIMPTIESLPDS
jgi:hypothetical protein